MRQRSMKHTVHRRVGPGTSCMGLSSSALLKSAPLILLSVRSLLRQTVRAPLLQRLRPAGAPHLFVAASCSCWVQLRCEQSEAAQLAQHEALVRWGCRAGRGAARAAGCGMVGVEVPPTW